MSRKIISKAEYLALLNDQGVDLIDAKHICPMCKTAQSAQDFVDAGIDRTEVEKYIGFSCIGRVDNSKGCDWSLGGLFQIHGLLVEDEDGKHHPRFLPVNMESK